MTEYMLGGEQKDLAWDGSDKLMKSVSMDCGEPVFEIKKQTQNDLP